MRSRTTDICRYAPIYLACWLCVAANVEAAPRSDTTLAGQSQFLATSHIAPGPLDERTSLDHGPNVDTKSQDGAVALANDAAGTANSVDCNEDLFGSIPSCQMCPCTYGWVEGLILWRNNQSLNQPLVLNLNTDDTLLSTGNLGFNAAGGIRAGFGFRTCTGVAWEFNYLGLYNQSASAFIALPDDLSLPGDLGLAVNNFFFADQVAVRYTSQLNNAEINRVCCCCCCDCPTRCRSVEWLYGFRYLNLNENFSITATDFQESTTTYRIRTNNNLFGAQVGSRLRHCYGRWSWEGTGKAGIFGNAAEQIGSPIVDFPGFLIRPTQSASRGQVAFVGDLNLSGIYQINSVWGVRTGYNLIWVEGVALAPNQLDFTNTPTSGTQLSSNGGVFLHGLNIGLEARW